jgi:tetratricopeptide (TPR) repeat protein
VRRDPKGIKGISPFWETLNKADRAYVARDYDAALATFANAIKLEPHNAMGHYRIGEVYLAKGMVKEAEAAWQAAVRYGDNQPVIKAKALFVLADLKEREREWDGTTSRWKVYQTFVRHPSAKGYPATAADRIKRVAEWRELEKKSAEVKERIERRLKEAEAKAQESAKVAPR